METKINKGRNMKRLLSFLLALVMVMALLPLANMTVYADSATSGNCGATASDNVTWEVTKSSGSEVYDILTISGTGAMKDYSSNNENPTPWLAYTNSISKVVINDGVTTIGEYAFFCFYNLNSITIPNSVKTIGKGAVQFCEKLISITIPNSVTTIGGCAFGECSALTSITIPSSVTSISNEAFTCCTSLTSVEFKGTSTNVGEYAFIGVGTSGGTSNPTLTLPEGWTGTAAPTNNTTDWNGGYFAGSSSTPICKIGETEYASIDAAIEAVTSGQTIQLTSDIDLTSTIVVDNDKNFTLDLNGHVLNAGNIAEPIEPKEGSTYDIGDKETMANVFANYGTLTIIDSNPTAEHTGTLAAYTGGILTGGKGGYNGVKKVDDGNYYGTLLGGAIYSSGTLTMTGGTITGNTSEEGSGICTGGQGGPLTLTNVTITGNTVDSQDGEYCGGGISIDHNSFTIGGKTVIDGNKAKDGTSNNVYIYPNCYISISTETPLIAGAQIGVTLESETGKFTSNGTADDAQYFFADNDDYYVSYNNTNGYLQMVEKFTPSTTVQEISCITLTNNHDGTVTIGNLPAFGTATGNNHTYGPDNLKWGYDLAFATQDWFDIGVGKDTILNESGYRRIYSGSTDIPANKTIDVTSIKYGDNSVPRICVVALSTDLDSIYNAPDLFGGQIFTLPTKVTYDLNGGTAGKGFVSTDWILSGEEWLTTDDVVNHTIAPTKEGCVFEGWYTAAEGGTKVTTTAEADAAAISPTSGSGSRSVTLYAHYQKDSAVDNAIAKIDAIGTVEYTDACKAKIDAARTAYDALTAAQQNLVTNYKVLTNAESKYAKLKKAADKYANSLKLNSALKGVSSGKAITVSWGAVKGADKYVLYGSYCGKGNTYKPIKTTTSTTFTVKKLNGKTLNTKKSCRFYVVAMKDGEIIGKSITIHVVGSKNTKYSNVKSVSVAKTSVTVKAGKTSKIKASLKLKDSSKKLLGHVSKFRYKSSNTSVATVTANGVIKGISKGKAVIYVYSTCGIAKKITVVVK